LLRALIARSLIHLFPYIIPFISRPDCHQIERRTSKVTPRRIVPIYLFISVLILIASVRVSSAQEIVLYASQAPVKVGSWSAVADSTAAGGARLANPDAGAPKIGTAAANPSSYAELTFSAFSGKPYRIWIRGKAQGDSPYNDSIFVQFSGSVTSSGSAVYRIGTSSATEINLEDCLGCGVQNWGWQDNGWGVLGPQIYFQTSGTQTLRIQTREDGLSIDQIVISAATYMNNTPGAVKNDTLILPASSGGTVSPTPTPTPTPTPSSPDVVIWAANVPSTSLRGNWVKESNASAAGQTALHNPDRGAAKIATASTNPADYFEVSFNAEAGKAYRIWVRGRADGDYWGNDSLFAQFSGSLNIQGQAAYRIGTSSAVEVNLEDCSGCSIQGWGWQDDGWGLNLLGPTIFFQTTGTQTLRIQTREDGLSIDQIVLSSYAYLYSSPGFLKNDNTILQSTLSVAPPPPPPNQAPQVSISATPTSGNSPLFVNFASAASDPDGSITSYSWTFGDGHTSSAVNPTNTYQSAGSFTARLTVTDNAGATASATVQINVSSPPPPPTTGTLRVLSYNASFGKGTDNVLNWDRTAQWITNINPDLVALCEMPSESIGALVTALQQKTGRTWYWHHVPKFNGTSEGNLILSKYPFSSTASRFLSYSRSVAQATVTVAGKTINFFATHLDPDSSTARYAQAGELLSFASGYSESRIICGDFNAGPDTSESVRMTSTYYDSWMQAMNVGTAVAYPDNPVYMHTRTRRGRIDYVWYSRGTGNLFLTGTQVPDTRNLSQTNVVVLLGTADDKGVRPSDHNPMIANFDIR
jgi:endonuclease/exonuclease/phosphatase family metal-dependent hydrolase